MGCFRPNDIMFELKNTGELYFMELECDAKLEKKTDLWSGKGHEEFGKFSPEHNSLKIGTFIGFFYTK